jgi:hypothetical protein
MRYGGTAMKKSFRTSAFVSLLLTGAMLVSCTSPRLAPSTIPQKQFSELTDLQVQTLESLQELSSYPYPLYSMHYYADYNFDDFLKHGLQAGLREGVYIQDSKSKRFCSTFSALNEQGDAILGHNIDWYKFPMLLLFTYPSDGYASVSLVSIDNLGYKSKNPSLSSLQQRSHLLNAPYLPHDGMNEYGLAVGEMTVEGDSAKDPEKKTIGPLNSIRLILDHAKNVEEAVSLLQDYNNSRGDVHYLISDSSGHSAVVEYIGGKMIVTRNKEPWQVATNFVINNAAPDSILDSCERYRTAYTFLKKHNGYISQIEAMGILENVSVPYDATWPFATQWSVVYNTTTGEVNAVVGRRFHDVFEFKLKMKSR